MNDEWLTVDDAAALLKVRAETIYRWVERGVLPCVKLGRTIRLDGEELRRRLKGLPPENALDLTDKKVKDSGKDRASFDE